MTLRLPPGPVELRSTWTCLLQSPNWTNFSGCYLFPVPLFPVRIDSQSFDAHSFCLFADVVCLCAPLSTCARFLTSVCARVLLSNWFHSHIWPYLFVDRDFYFKHLSRTSFRFSGRFNCFVSFLFFFYVCLFVVAHVFAAKRWLRIVFICAPFYTVIVLDARCLLFFFSICYRFIFDSPEMIRDRLCLFPFLLLFSVHFSQHCFHDFLDC